MTFQKIVNGDSALFIYRNIRPVTGQERKEHYGIFKFGSADHLFLFEVPTIHRAALVTGEEKRSVSGKRKRSHLLFFLRLKNSMCRNPYILSMHRDAQQQREQPGGRP